MIVSAGSDWGWKDSTNGVDCLKDSLQVESSSDFSDQNWSKSLVSQFFVNAEVVHFCRSKSVPANSQVDGDSRYEANELLGLTDPNPDVPIFAPSRCFQCPAYISN